MCGYSCRSIPRTWRSPKCSARGCPGLSRTQISFSLRCPLAAVFGCRSLPTEIAEADAFLLLIGPKGIGPWQEVEYFTAFDRHVNEKSFALVPVIAAGAQAPGLSFLRSLNWVEAPVVTEDTALHRIIAALKGEAPASHNAAVEAGQSLSRP